MILDEVQRLPGLFAELRGVIDTGRRAGRGTGRFLLLGLADADALLGHPVTGASWEGFVIENLLTLAPEGCQGWFYRKAAGAEVDLVLEWPDQRRRAIEVKRSLSRSLGKGFHQARADLQPERTFVVIPGEQAFPLAEGVEAVGLAELAAQLRDRGRQG